MTELSETLKYFAIFITMKVQSGSQTNHETLQHQGNFYDSPHHGG